MPSIDIIKNVDGKNFGAILRCDRASRGVEQQIVDTVRDLFKPTAARIVPWIEGSQAGDPKYD